MRQLKRKGDTFPDLVAALGRVAGNITDVRVDQVGGYFVTELKQEMGNGRSAWFPLAQVSDGTLRALGLLTTLYQNAPQALIAIEEPELTLHPGVFGLLSDVLYEASTRNQVLITTQSPDLISRFSADELRVVERIKGLSSVGPVDERQRVAINEQLFSAGDLLRIEGLHITPTAEAA